MESIILPAKELLAVKADFAVRVNFLKGTHQPEDVFRATQEFILALKEIDDLLFKSLGMKSKPTLSLQEVKSGSILLFFKNALERVDDQDVKDFKINKMLGAVSLEMKHNYLDWYAKRKGMPTHKQIKSLQKQLNQTASKNKIPENLIYSVPSSSALMKPLIRISGARALLPKGQDITFNIPNKKPVEIKTALITDQRNLDKNLTSTTLKSKPSKVILLVKKPDYLGKSKWDMRLDGKYIQVSFSDISWLNNFHKRKYDVRPGDSLLCLLKTIRHYDYENNPVFEEYVITKVISVGRPESGSKQIDMFDAD